MPDTAQLQRPTKAVRSEKAALNGVGSWLLDRLIFSLVELFSQTLEMIRLNRSFPRRHAIGDAQRPRKAYR